MRKLKKCRQCGKKLGKSRFNIHSKKVSGRDHICRACRQIRNLNRRAHKLGHKGYIKKDEVQAQYEYQKGVCYYCGEPMRRMRFTLDHVIPLSRGGYHDITNIVCACNMCNSRKDAMSEDKAMRVIHSDGKLSWCRFCDTVKPSNHFRVDKEEKFGLSWTCRQCEFEFSQAY